MSSDGGLAEQIISRGNLVVLRRWLEKDHEHLARWMTQGEWLLFDAPWEEIELDGKPEQDQAEAQVGKTPDAWFNNRAIIATLDDIPLGWVNRYGDKQNPYVWYVGIDICEDAFLNRGMGTEALQLWVDHLFSVSDIHKLCLDTWSFNQRMIRVAAKVGFVPEGCQREMQLWEGEWLDLLHFGMLRNCKSQKEF